MPTGIAVGWKADELLALGSKLHLAATFVGAQTPALEAELEVTAEPTPLPTGGLNLERWLNVGHGVGEWITCEVGDMPATGIGGSCANAVAPSSSINLPSSEQILRAVNTSWTRMSPDTFVAWQAHVELPDGPDQDAPPVSHFFLGKSAAMLPPEEMGRLLFPVDTQKYCAVLVVRDLWNGEEVKSQVCGEPPADVPTTRDYPIDACAQPPNEELKWAWCQPQARWSDPACAQFLNGGGGPPMMPTAGGPASAPAGSGTAGLGAGGSLATSTGLQPKENSGTSSGCRLGAVRPTAPGLGALASAALLLTWFGRRRRSDRAAKG